VSSPSVSASSNGSELAVQLSNFPLGTTYFFCHTGDGSGYPTGGSISNHGQFNVTSPNQGFSSGLCSGSGNFWIGLQATDGHDYYSNQVALQAPSPPPLPSTWGETTGGVTHTWTNWTNAGGTEGPTIGSNVTVQIACRLTGWTAPNGNNWWYRIAQAPWSGTYYASADAFYNNGATSGSLSGTPFVDPAVANC
jgi:hypothetical protein